MRSLTISIDFDGVIVTSQYPKIGRVLDGAIETINKWCEDHFVIINTCRAGKELEIVRDFIYSREINCNLINENSPYLIEKYGTDTRKISADLYLDDKSMGGFCGWKRADAYVTWLANRKPIIFAIVGESSSGKTSLAEYIESEYGIPMIESYTTRPRRTEGETGHTFVSEQDFNEIHQSDMIAFTEFGGHKYCCLHADVRDENTYVIDEYGLRYLKDNFSELYDIKSIRCYCNEAERIRRGGEERAARDKGRFTMDRKMFDFVWETDSWRDTEYYDTKKKTLLHNFLIKNLNRGWN